MKKFTPFFLSSILLAGVVSLVVAAPEPVKPLRILLVAGGCCHEYGAQTEVLKNGIESRINAIVDVAYNPDTTTKATFGIYESKDWAKDFDVIIHDECSADVTDPAYVENILAAHRAGKPAVNLHCAMHSYRWGNFQEPVAPGSDNSHWYEMIGIQSTRHGPKEPIAVTFTDKDNPITKGMEDWTTIGEELYNNIQVLTAQGLAIGKQMVPPQSKKGAPAPPDAKPREESSIVVWTNEYGPNKTRIFSTTLGHFTETVADARYLDLVTRGLLWSVGKLGDDGMPASGYAAQK